MPEIKSIGLTQTFELGGKREARGRVADFNVRAAAATLDEFLRNLRLDAAVAFAQTLAAQQVYEQKRRSAAILDDLLAANEQRLRVGDIGEVDVLQTRVEARQSRSEALASEADVRAMRIALTNFLGRDRAGASLVAIGRLEQPPRDYDPQRLRVQMLANRSDLAALRHARDSAAAAIELARAGRYPDLNVGIGVTRSERSFNSVAPSPKFDALGVTFALPIPLFNRNRAEISIASLRFGQAERMLEAAEQNAEVDLLGAYQRNRIAADRVAQFLAGALEDANQVLQAKRYSYERGQTTLLDLLEAQRSSNEVHLSYYEALSERAAALIALERAAGLWDIAF
jgi:cobalt-zinc-cadmium efflux system outer membrane protein